MVLAEDRSVSPPRKLAIKVMSKSHIVRERQVEHTHHEKNILFSVRCPFIVKFVDYFMDRTSLYIVQELCVGGEFYNFLQDRPKGRLTASEAKFYAAQTVLAFEYLHNLEIIFRDLKPENMLLDQNGNIKLVDFGFAKRVKDKTYTFCGTPEYLAPELLSNSGYVANTRLPSTSTPAHQHTSTPARGRPASICLFSMTPILYSDSPRQRELSLALVLFPLPACLLACMLTCLVPCLACIGVSSFSSLWLLAGTTTPSTGGQ